jgi:hypothetical protein
VVYAYLATFAAGDKPHVQLQAVVQIERPALTGPTEEERAYRPSRARAADLVRPGLAGSSPSRVPVSDMVNCGKRLDSLSHLARNRARAGTRWAEQPQQSANV